ncbi:MAG TPA: YtxH domain-containing protein [Gemmatimonadaceae bacterium]|jgi:gas vesicle protein|nr:YtxH domain-containing protein [Gemmatimonadaceae bacterium]
MTDDMRNDDRRIVIEKSGVGAGILAFLAGLAVGAGAALLYAPKSGAETRHDIAERGRRVRERAQEMAGDLRDRAESGVDSAREVVGRGRRKVTRAVATGRQAAGQAREDLERRLGAAKSAYRAGIASKGDNSSNDEPDHDE